MVDTVGTPNHYLEESHPGKIWDLHWYVWERNIYCGEAPILGLFSWEASMNCWLRKTGRDTYHVHFTDENTEAKKKNTQFVQDQNPVTDRAEIELIYWALKFVHFCCFFVFFFLIMCMFCGPLYIFQDRHHLAPVPTVATGGKSLLFPGYLGIKFMILYLLSSLGFTW